MPILTSGNYLMLAAFFFFLSVLSAVSGLKGAVKGIDTGRYLIFSIPFDCYEDQPIITRVTQYKIFGFFLQVLWLLFQF